MKGMCASNFALISLLFSASAGLAAPGQTPDKPVTADQQKQNTADRELTQKIRQSIVADKSLSVSAHNVKIVSRNGSVTLKGKVKSDQEKKAVVDKATELAGPSNVTDEITVASK